MDIFETVPGTIVVVGPDVSGTVRLPAVSLATSMGPA
jgi:hypothetical protein